MNDYVFSPVLIYFIYDSVEVLYNMQTSLMAIAN